MKNDRYQVLGPSGEGGMALVFRARDTKLNRFVAIKQMSPELESDPAAVKAFEKEAAILGSLRDPNIVLVYDTIADEDGHYYLIMEFVEGSTLAQIIRAGPTDVATALRIIEQILNGLHSMHKAGIVHHDLKPHNILIDAEGTAKIADFGLAAAVGDDGPTLDWGSVQYMAPEIFSGNYIQDARIDIYALGMVVFELLLGQAAFRGECKSIYEGGSENPSKRWVNWQMDSTRHLRPLAEVDARIPQPLSEIVGRMLAKDRQNRYGDVSSILKDLKDKRHEQGDVDMEDSDKTKPISEFRTTGKKPAEPPPVFVKKKSSSKLLYVGAIMSVVTVGVVILASSQDSKPVKGGIAITPGAELFVDGKSAGSSTKGLRSATMAPGSHTIRAVMGGHDPAEETILVQAGKPWSVTLTPKETVKIAQVESKPAENPARIETPSGPMVLVSAGEFRYGNEGKSTTLPAFYIDEVEVTNAAFHKFCEATGRKPPPAPFWDSEYFTSKPNYPVLNVMYDEAVAFAEWAGKRLPGELEWEKAARGPDGRSYPWGSNFEPAKANLAGKADHFQFTSPVGSFPEGRSPYGTLDMVGNVWEWVANPYGTGLAANDRVLKGGSFLNSTAEDTTAYFHGARPGSERPNSVGFRCAKDAPPTISVALPSRPTPSAPALSRAPSP